MRNVGKPINYEEDKQPLVLTQPLDLGKLNHYATESQLKSLEEMFSFKRNPVTDPRVIVSTLIERLSDESKWIQGSWHTAADCSVTYGKPCTDRYCFMGHVLSIMWNGTNEEAASHLYTDNDRQGLNMLYQDIKSLANRVVRDLTNGRYTEVINYNDADATTWHDVNCVAREMMQRLDSYEPVEEGERMSYVLLYERINYNARAAQGTLVALAAAEAVAKALTTGSKVVILANTNEGHNLKVGSVGLVGPIEDDYVGEHYSRWAYEGEFAVRVRGITIYDDDGASNNQWVLLSNLRILTEDESNVVEYGQVLDNPNGSIAAVGTDEDEGFSESDSTDQE